MKNNICKKGTIVAIILLSYAATLTGQEIKRGWNFGPLPAISFNSDQGFQYGALCDIYWFGDGSTYPNYIHKFNVEISRYTKGSGIYHLFYDSKYLIKGLRTTLDISYLTDKMMDFYGFDGYVSAYKNDMGNGYYKFDRNLFRTTLDLQGNITKNLGWVAGAGIYSYKTGAVTDEKYANEPSLYKKYVDAGIISPLEKDGGTRVELKLGAVYDTRDNEADPYRGVKGEAIAVFSPGSDKSGYTKLYLSASGFLPVYKEKLTFAARATYQGTLSGTQPYYMLQNITTLYFRQITSEGLGGLNTIRGVLRNRVTGSGVLMGNAELRYRFAPFMFLKQNWYLVLNPFIDAGRVVQYYRKDLLYTSSNSRVLQMIDDGELDPAIDDSFHVSAGLGFKAVMNRNFIISAEWGKPFDSRDGKSGLNIGLNFIF